MNSGFLICFLLLSQIQATPPTYINITNVYGEQVTLWFKPDAVNKWGKPRRIASEGEMTIHLMHDGKYLLVARDTGKRDERLGRYNLREIARVAPDARIYVGTVQRYEAATETVIKYRTETRELSYTICKPCWETRTRIVEYFDQATGQLKEKTVNYKVCHMVPEQRTRTVQQQVPYREQVEVQNSVQRPVLQVRVNGELVLLDDYLRDRS